MGEELTKIEQKELEWLEQREYERQCEEGYIREELYWL